MRKTCLALAACLFLPGCVIGSLNPFYTEDLVVTQPQLNGSWYFSEEIEANDESPLVLADGKMTLFDDKGKPADAKVTYFKIDDTLFIDIFAEKGRLKEEVASNQPPVHLVSRLKIIEQDKISFDALDYNWLSKEVTGGTISLPYQKITGSTDDDIVFTAKASQWVQFLREHKDDPKAFPPDGEAVLIRKPPQKK